MNYLSDEEANKLNFEKIYGYKDTNKWFIKVLKDGDIVGELRGFRTIYEIKSITRGSETNYHKVVYATLSPKWEEYLKLRFA